MTRRSTTRHNPEGPAGTGRARWTGEKGVTKAAPRGEVRSKTLEKGILLLQCMATAHGPKGVTELARMSGMDKSTVYRLLQTFRKYHFVAQTTDERYVLSYGLFELARADLQNDGLAQVALGPLIELQGRVPETVNLAVRRGSRCVYVLSLQSPQSVSMQARPVGFSEMLHCTALGKALLAFSAPETVEALLKQPLPPRTPYTITDPQVLQRGLEQVRRRGWSTDLQENEPETRCVAAPVRAPDGTAIAAISVSAPAYRLPDGTLPLVGNLLIQTASLISERLATMGWRV